MTIKNLKKYVQDAWVKYQKIKKLKRKSKKSKKIWKNRKGNLMKRNKE